jgi:hypothetical protein
MTDRRQDARTREIIQTIEADWQAAIVQVRHNYRRLLLYVAVLTFALCALITGAFVLFAEQQNQRQEGRAIAIQASCAATSAVIDAGRRTILTGGDLPPKFARELERLGYPSAQARKARARAAAEAYARSIAEAVERQSGV